MTTRTEEVSCGAGLFCLPSIRGLDGRRQSVLGLGVLSSTTGQHVCRCFDTGHLESVSCPGGKGALDLHCLTDVGGVSACAVVYTQEGFTLSSHLTPASGGRLFYTPLRGLSDASSAELKRSARP